MAHLGAGLPTVVMAGMGFISQRDSSSQSALLKPTTFFVIITPTCLIGSDKYLMYFPT